MPKSWDELMNRLADQFRGSVEMIRQDQETRYLTRVQQVYNVLQKPVMDIGSGRGEWLTILNAAKISSIGIELNPLLAENLKNQGLHVVCRDALEFLRSQSTRSFSVITAFQVLEHWTAPMVWEVLNLAFDALDVGGMVIFETVNVSSLWAWNHFAYDPTHVLPLPPELLRFMVSEAGFSSPTIEYFSPIPQHMQVPLSVPNAHVLNQWLYGPQDYAVIAYKETLR
ncbi:MAG: methyltransferase domain-containing protein [Sulfobacillus sp.]|nr:methyltransferase domain-containing protein [Sulfobacillus sp.]